MAEWVGDNPWAPALLGIAAIGGLIKLGMWIGAVNTDRESFRAFMEEVRGDIKKILGRVPAQTVERGSPLRLTEFGEEISRKLDVKTWALNEAMAQFERVDRKEHYEVHDFCIEHVQMQFDLGDEFYVRVRAGAYDNGTTVKNVQDVFVIELRDALLRLMGEQR